MPLPPPPHDSDGNVQPHDCLEIAGDDVLIRRVSQQQISEIDGTVSSVVFKQSSGVNGGMSVDIEKLIREAGVDPKTFVTTPKWVGSVYFTAEALRSLGFIIGPEPIQEPANPFHGEVWGEFNKSQRRQLRNIAEWYVPIEGAIIR